MVTQGPETIPDHWRNALVLMLAHGSKTTPEATNVVLAQASRLAARNLFSDVRAVFLRDHPHPKEIIDQALQRDIFVVPFMTSEGYSTETLIPKAIGLAGPLTERSSLNTRHQIHICQSIGTHRKIEDHIVTLINEVISRNDLSIDDTVAVIASHGTARHPGNNRQSTLLENRISGSCGVHEAHAVFIEEPPFITEWQTMTDLSNVLIIPHLMTFGRHAAVDVPTAVGIPPDTKAFQRALCAGQMYGPHETHGRRIWFAPTIGSFDTITDIVVERIRDRGLL